MSTDANTHAGIAAALAAAQTELRDPPRNKEGQRRNGKQTKYAGLDDILSTARPVLASHGIAISQPVEVIDGTPTLVSRLLHTSGETLQSVWILQSKGSPQERGSELTYARRYTLEGLIGVAATDDDDGQASSKQQPRVERRGQVVDTQQRRKVEPQAEQLPQNSPEPQGPPGHTESPSPAADGVPLEDQPLPKAKREDVGRILAMLREVDAAAELEFAEDWIPAGRVAYTNACGTHDLEYQVMSDATAFARKGKRPGELTEDDRVKAYRGIRETERGRQILSAAIAAREQVLERYDAIPRNQRTELSAQLGWPHKSPNQQRTVKILRTAELWESRAPVGGGE